MNIVSILVVAVGLSIDSLTVSIAAASTCKQKNNFVFLRFAFTLGFIQALCAIAGWAAGSELIKYIEEYDHWVAFALLSIIAGKMFYDGFAHKDSEDKPEINMRNFFVVAGLGIATSIDAAVVGLSMSFAGFNIWISALIIMIVTFCFSYMGLISGQIIRKALRKFPIEIVGGLFLLGIGVKILAEHLMA